MVFTMFLVLLLLLLNITYCLGFTSNYIHTIDNSIIPNIINIGCNNTIKTGLIEYDLNSCNNVINGTGYLNSSIILYGTNIIYKTDSRNFIQNQYINLGLVQSGITNPTRDYKDTGFGCVNNANIVNGKVETNSYLSESQANAVNSNVSGLYVVSDGCFVAVKKSGDIGSFGCCKYPVNVILDTNIVQVATSMRGVLTLNKNGYIKNYGPYSNGEKLNYNPETNNGHIFKKIWAGGYALYAGLTTTNTLIVWGCESGRMKYFYYENTNVKQIGFEFDGGGYLDENNNLKLFGNTKFKKNDFNQIINSDIKVDEFGNWNYLLSYDDLLSINNKGSIHLFVSNVVNDYNHIDTLKLNAFDNSIQPTFKPTIEPIIEPTIEPTFKPTFNNTDIINKIFTHIEKIIKLYRKYKKEQKNLRTNNNQ